MHRGNKELSAVDWCLVRVGGVGPLIPPPIYHQRGNSFTVAKKLVLEDAVEDACVCWAELSGNLQIH
jgi:hypothetical protein